SRARAHGGARTARRAHGTVGPGSGLDARAAPARAARGGRLRRRHRGARRDRESGARAAPHRDRARGRAPRLRARDPSRSRPRPGHRRGAGIRVGAVERGAGARAQPAALRPGPAGRGPRHRALEQPAGELHGRGDRAPFRRAQRDQPRARPARAGRLRAPRDRPAARAHRRGDAARVQRHAGGRVPAPHGEARGDRGRRNLRRRAARLLDRERGARADPGRRRPHAAAVLLRGVPASDVPIPVHRSTHLLPASTMNPVSRRAVLASGAGFAAANALLARTASAASRERTLASPALPPGRPGIDYTPVVTPNGAALPWKLVDGVKVYHLVAEPVLHEFAPGLEAECWGYNGSVHGPTIEAVEGDRVRIYVTNKLGAPTTVHWHGVLLPCG